MKLKLSWAIKLLTASTIVFLFAGILSISLLALSATQMKITPGTPKAEVTETSAKITIPIQISNQGFLTIRSLTLQTTILDKNSEKLSEGKTSPLDIPTKSEVEVPVSITLDFKAITPETLRRLAFNDESFTIEIRGGLSLDPLLSLALSARTMLQWSAPISDFKIGEPKFTPHNVTHILISVPITFTNNSPFIKLNATMKGELYDTAGNLVGSSGRTAFVVPSHTFYEGEVAGPVKASVVAAGTIQLRIIFTTLYGTFTKEVSLVA
jgi:LEA14-like dessication related protein